MNVLVTGISRGLGFEITQYLLEKEVTVYGICTKSNPQLDALQAQYPKQLNVLHYDLTNLDDIRKSIFKEFVSNSVVLHGFVNNAAMAYDDIITNANKDRLEQMFAVNTFAPIMLVKYAIRNMIFNRTKGSIIHLSSISVHTGYKGLSMYASTKGALEAFLKNTAREWGERGVRSNCIVAGFMETDMSAKLSEEQKNRIYLRNSLKRPTTLRSVASMVEFLLSDQSESVTGQNLFVDSGTI